MSRYKSARKIFIVIFSTILLAVLALAVGRYFLFSKIKSNLRGRLETLRKDGIEVKFKSAKINVWNGRIELQDLNVKLKKDSLRNDIQLNIPFVLIKEIEVLPFVLDKVLHIGAIVIDQPDITYRLSSRFVEKNQGRQRVLFENINIDNVSLNDVILHLKDSLGKDTVANLKGHLHIHDLGILNQHDSLAWDNADISLTNFTATLPDAMYEISVKKALLSLEDERFELDSLKVSPLYSRKKFMKRMGKATDRVGGVISYLNLNGIKFTGKPYPLLRAGTMKLNVNFSIYRDKRYAFKKEGTSLLPSHFVQRLPFKLEADSIVLEDSYVSYEEFPEEGDSTGRIYFEKLNATITDIHNYHNSKRNITMKAEAKLMGVGDLRANFIFPGDTTKPYKASGSLQNLPLTSLNGMLGPSAKARIESGLMTNLKFDFDYNMYRSNGTVELNYKNLRISSLKSNRKNEQSVSVIKTLLLNTFIVKKDMDEDVSDARKTGTILFYRDEQKSIFNYWWKSLLSGIKSAFRIDKIPVVKNLSKKGRKKKELKQQNLIVNKKKD